MFRACTVVTIMAAGLAMAACSSDSAPTAPKDPPPTFRTEKSPAGGGAQVSHAQGQFFATFTAPVRPTSSPSASARAPWWISAAAATPSSVP